MRIALFSCWMGVEREITRVIIRRFRLNQQTQTTHTKWFANIRINGRTSYADVCIVRGRLGYYLATVTKTFSLSHFS